MFRILLLVITLSILIPTAVAAQSRYYTPYQTPPAQQYNPSDPYGTKPYTRGFGLSGREQRQIDRSNRNTERNSIFTTGCHLYTRECVNRLRSLGR